MESDWTVKNDKPHYGLKEHASVDIYHGLILATTLTSSSVNDTTYLPYCTLYSRHTGRNASSGQRDAQLKKTCCELESLFINYLLKKMRQIIDKSGFISGGGAEEINSSMLDTHMVKQFTHKLVVSANSVFSVVNSTFYELIK